MDTSGVIHRGDPHVATSDHRAARMCRALQANTLCEIDVTSAEHGTPK